MRCLYVDLASGNGAIACSTEQSCAAFTALEPSFTDAHLVKCGEDLLGSIEWSYDDLTHIACVTGPGGFTSLRMAAAYVNTMSSHLKIPSAGIHLSDVYKSRSLEEEIVWLHSTKKDEIFIRAWELYDAKWLQPTHEILSTLSLDGAHKWCGEVIDEHRVVLGDGVQEEARLHSYDESIPSIVSGATFGSDQIMPWYGRQG